MSATHFDRALDATRKGYVAARDVAADLEGIGLNLKIGGPRLKRNPDYLRAVKDRLLDLRLLVDDLEAHLRLSDAAEEHALSK